MINSGIIIYNSGFNREKYNKASIIVRSRERERERYVPYYPKESFEMLGPVPEVCRWPEPEQYTYTYSLGRRSSLWAQGEFTWQLNDRQVDWA